MPQAATREDGTLRCVVAPPPTDGSDARDVRSSDIREIAPTGAERPSYRPPPPVPRATLRLASVPPPVPVEARRSRPSTVPPPAAPLASVPAPAPPAHPPALAMPPMPPPALALAPVPQIEATRVAPPEPAASAADDDPYLEALRRSSVMPDAVRSLGPKARHAFSSAGGEEMVVGLRHTLAIVMRSVGVLLVRGAERVEG